MNKKTTLKENIMAPYNIIKGTLEIFGITKSEYEKTIERLKEFNSILGTPAKISIILLLKTSNKPLNKLTIHKALKEIVLKKTKNKIEKKKQDS